MLGDRARNDTRSAELMIERMKSILVSTRDELELERQARQASEKALAAQPGKIIQETRGERCAVNRHPPY